MSRVDANISVGQSVYWAVATLAPLLFYACPKPAAPVESKPELNKLRNEVLGLRAELDELKQTVVDLDNQVDELVLKQRLDESDPGVPLLNRPAPTPTTVPEPHDEAPTPIPAAVPSQPLCVMTMEVVASDADAEYLAKVTKLRAEALGAQNVTTTPHDLAKGIILNFQAALADGPKIHHWIAQDNLFSVSWIVPNAFTTPELESKLSDFAKLYPQQATTLTVVETEVGPSVESENVSDIRQFSDQMFGLTATTTTIIERTVPLAGRSGTPIRWRLAALEQPPLLTQDDLLSAESANDGDSPTLRLRLNSDGLAVLVDATQARTGRKLAFLVGGELYHTHVVHAPVVHGTIELPVLAQTPELAQQQGAQLAKLLSSGRYISNITVAEYTDIQCPKSQ